MRSGTESRDITGRPSPYICVGVGSSSLICVLLAFTSFIDETACTKLRKGTLDTKHVPIDFATEDANYRVKHGTFTRGLPTEERIKNYVLANDRMTSKWNCCNNLLARPQAKAARSHTQPGRAEAKSAKPQA